MRKQKKFFNILILFFIVLFSVSCNKDIVSRIKDKIPIFNKGNTKSEGIGKYAGEWFASEIMMGGDVVDRYTINENTKPSIIINSNGSITITSNGEVIKDIEEYGDTTYGYTDSESNYFVLEFESEIRCLQVSAGEEGDYTTVLIKRQ